MKIHPLLTHFLFALLFSGGALFLVIGNNLHEKYPFAYAEGTVTAHEEGEKNRFIVVVEYMIGENKYTAKSGSLSFALQDMLSVGIGEKVRIYYSEKEPDFVFINEAGIAFILAFCVGAVFMWFVFFRSIRDYFSGLYFWKGDSDGLYLKNSRVYSFILVGLLVQPLGFMSFGQEFIWWLQDPTYENLLDRPAEFIWLWSIIPFNIIMALVMLIAFFYKKYRRPKVRFSLAAGVFIRRKNVKSELFELNIRPENKTGQRKPLVVTQQLWVRTEGKEYFLADSFFVRSLEKYAAKIEEITGKKIPLQIDQN